MSEINTDSKYTIWGFEEPENSAEYKNQQQLASEFKTIYAKKNQIFITTHSEEFLQLYDGIEIESEKRMANIYHVLKKADSIYSEYSQVYKFDVDADELNIFDRKSFLDAEPGQSHLRAKYSKELKSLADEFLREKNTLQEGKKHLIDNIERASKPLVFVEDTNNELYK